MGGSNATENNVSSTRLEFAIVSLLLAASADGAAGQYRRQVEELPPAFAVSASIGALLSYDESVTPVETPLPDENRRGRRSVDTQPTISLAARYGRGIAVYGNVLVAPAGEVELSGNSPETGAPLTGTEDLGTLTITSIGASFVPVRSVMGLRLDIGPAWLNLGEGGSYLGVRVAGSARFLEIGDRVGVALGWDGHFAGGQNDRDSREYQIIGGMISGLRLGFDLEF